MVTKQKFDTTKGDVPDFLMSVIGDRFQLDMIRLVGMSLQKYFLVPYTLFKRKSGKIKLLRPQNCFGS